MGKKDIVDALRAKGYSENQIESAIQALEKKEEQKARAKERRQARMNDPEFKKSMLRTHRKRNIRIALMVQKAKEAGIEVTDAEVMETYRQKYGED